jgi:hypothetical protein
MKINCVTAMKNWKGNLKLALRSGVPEVLGE